MRWTRNGTASSAKGRESSLCPRLMWLALWPLRTLRPKRYVLKSMLKCHLANQALTHRDKSTSQVCHQGFWSHCSRKQPLSIQTYHSSTHHSSPQAQLLPSHSPPQMATHTLSFRLFQQRQQRYSEMRRTQMTISTAQTFLFRLCI